MMMMQQKPTVDVPPWSGRHLPVSGVYPNTDIAMSSLQQYLPLLPTNNNYDDEEVEDEDVDSSSFAVAVAVAAAVVDAYSCDEFRMYEFKVRGCVRGRSHDWTECPYAHPGEKARRRDPQKYHYSGTPCPDFRKGSCKRGDACEYAHGVFECWLHPTRYRTQPCKDGTTCRRRVCFFAHTPDQLRDSSYDGYAMSPTGGGGSPLTELMASMRKLQLGKVKSMPHTAATLSPTWRLIGGGGGDGGGFCSLPSTPISNNSNFNGNRRFGGINGWDLEEEVDVAEERVESGRALRAKLYEKLSKDADVGPDVGWVSELVK